MHTRWLILWAGAGVVLISSVFAALGELGLCQDGLPKDGDGARLWPLALHNHIVLTRSRAPRKSRVDAFAAFDLEVEAAVDDMVAVGHVDALEKH